MKLPQWVTTSECLSGAHCGTCRDLEGGRTWRVKLSNGFEMPRGAPDFDCPYGREWGSNGAGKVELTGVGTELKKLLARAGFEPTPDCACNAMALRMNVEGAEWCEANVNVILEVMRAEAERRGVPFWNVCGRLLVRRAITNFRKGDSAAG